MKTTALHTVTADELKLALASRHPQTAILRPMVCNTSYHCVTRDWVDRTFAPYVRQLLHATQKAKWRKRGNQCEHFAMRCVLEAVNCLDADAQRRADITAESVAAAWIAYNTDAGGGHAIVSWYIDDQWHEWEPQSQQWVYLSAQELRSVYSPFIL